MDDAKIIHLYWQRNQQAINETKDKYGGYCFRISFNILNNVEDSEECVNDTYLKAWNAIPPQKPNSLRMFLAKITRNLSINRFNSRVAKMRGGGEMTLVLDELAECLSHESDVFDDFQAKELGQFIRAFVNSLPKRDGNVFIRRYFFAESINEIAAKYGLTHNNTMVILSRTRNKLKNQLIKEGFCNE